MKFRTQMTILVVLLAAFVLPLHTTHSDNPTYASYVSNAFADVRTAPQLGALPDLYAMLADELNLNPEKQAACAADASGTLFSYNGDMRIIPASVSKLYLFDFALSKLPTTFRYTTTFVLSNGTLYINGAGDPQMTAEHLQSVLDEIHADGNPPIDTIAIAPDFYFGMTKYPPTVRAAVARAVPGVRVLSIDAPYDGDGKTDEKRYQFQSIPLPAFLKQTSNYSNNFFADALFTELGGPEAFADYMARTYDAGPETVKFSTGSGLSGNYTTCAQTLKVLEHLDKTLAAKDLTLTDVMTMPEVDPGVLSTRSIDEDAVESLVAKSGYLNSHHNLAGIINNDSGHVYFATFTDYPMSIDGRKVNHMVDDFTNDILAELKSSLQSLDYVPDPTVFHDYEVTAK